MTDLPTEASAKVGRKPLVEFIAEGRACIQAEDSIKTYSKKAGLLFPEALDRLEELAAENAELQAALARLTGADHG